MIRSAKHVNVSAARAAQLTRAVAMVLILVVCWPASANDDYPEEPSGIIVHDQWIYIVGNESNDMYFRYPVGLVNGDKRVVSINPDVVAPNPIKIARKDANDLESIAMRGDDVVVLSEDSMRVYDKNDRWLNYGELAIFKEIDKRGLEGLAVRELPDGTYHVALAHEYVPFPNILDEERPLLLVHKSGPDPTNLGHDEYCPQIKQVAIQSPYGGDTFRCTDLVWCWSTNKKPEGDWGLLLLLSNVDKDNHPNEKYVHEYDLEGNPVGVPQKLDDLGMPTDLIGENWEGMCWHKNQLLLVNDTNKKKDMYIVRLDAPPAVLPGKP